MSLLRALYRFSIFISLASAICYFPNGSATNSDVPCLSGNEPSWCCGQGFLCLSNRMCAGSVNSPHNNNNFWRGTCTDKTWRAANCPSFCLDDEDDIEKMELCPDDESEMEGNFFCDNGGDYYDACNSGIGLPVRGAKFPKVLTSINFDVAPAISASQSSDASTSETSVTATSHTSASRTSTREAGQTSSATSTTTRTKTADATSTDSDNLSRYDMSHHDTLSDGAIAGIVIGAIALFLICAGLAYFCGRRHHKKKAAQEMSEDQTSAAYIAANWSADNEAAKYQSKPNAGTSYLPELHGQDRSPELDSRHISELPEYSSVVASSGGGVGRSPVSPIQNC